MHQWFAVKKTLAHTHIDDFDWNYRYFGFCVGTRWIILTDRNNCCGNAKFQYFRNGHILTGCMFIVYIIYRWNGGKRTTGHTDVVQFYWRESSPGYFFFQNF